jgi:MerR family transcriptional regulator, light-induced transcriptional regulator
VFISCIVFSVRPSDGLLRIGELAQRTGVSPELLRAWEQRYGLLRPSRSSGGFRLYSGDDEARVRRTVQLIQSGLSAAQAARAALSEPSPTETASERSRGWFASPEFERTKEHLTSALDSFDGEQSNAAIDELLSGFTLETVLREVLLPYLRDLGDRWAGGTATVSQEHFASNLIRGRLMGLARGWDKGDGPRVLLACPPGESHDLGLIMFGIVVSQRGWRVTYLGADTPFSTLVDTSRRLRPDLIVLAATVSDVIRSQAPEVRELASVAPVWLGGGISSDDARAVGVTLLPGDPVQAARFVSAKG